MAPAIPRLKKHQGRIAAARQNVENDVGGMHALLQGLGAGAFDRGETVVENGGEDFHHLPIAIGRACELAADLFYGGGQNPIFERRAIP